MSHAAGTVTKLLSSDEPRLIAELQHEVGVRTADFWRLRDGRMPFLPMTTGAVSSPMGRGSDSTPVLVDIGGHPTFLADSMQFHLELALRITGRPCYYLMPSFRGESADTTHLPQFFHAEAEVQTDLDGILAIVEDYLRFLVSSIVERCGGDLSDIAGGTAHLERFLLAPAIPRLRFEDAADLIPENVVDHGEWRTITRAGEARLIERLGGALWLTHFDHLAVPFYQAWESGHQSTQAANADLLLGYGEVVGAGQRHQSADATLEALRQHGVDPASYEWYVEMKRCRPLATSGFGLGVERFLMWVLGRSDIRQVQFLRRDQPAVQLP